MSKQKQLYPVLAVGRMYRIKDSEKIKTTTKCVKFTGVEKYKGEQSEYWKEVIGTGGDFKLEEESGTSDMGGL